MGTPNYPEDPGKTLRDLKRLTTDAMTQGLLSSKNGRPWIPATVSDAQNTLWPSTTSASFTDCQIGSSIRSHPNFSFWVRVVAPAGGAQFRILYQDGSTVLAGPQTYTNGSFEWTGTFAIPAGLSYYEEFNVYLQCKSTVAGQTSKCIFGRLYGRS